MTAQAVLKVPRSVHEGARDMACQISRSWDGRTSRRLRKKIEMLFAHLKRIHKLDQLRLRGPNGARGEFLLAATAQNLRKLANWYRCQARTKGCLGKGGIVPLPLYLGPAGLIAARGLSLRAKSQKS
jgi:hypothetical protein